MSRNAYVLGLNCAYHESSVCILKNGQLVAFIEEERLNRVKHAKPSRVDNADELPLLSIAYCLKQAKISFKDIAHVGYNFNPTNRLAKNLKHHHPYKVTPGDFGTKEGEELFYQKNLNVEKKIKELGFRGEFHYLNHHDCHAAGAYFSSGFKSAAVLVVDGIGEYESTTLYKAVGTKLEKIDSLDFPNSLGFLWEKISKYLGFSAYDAAKVMGLTSYGDATIYRKKFDKLISINQDGTFIVDDSIIQFRNEDYSKLESLFNLKKNGQVIGSVNETNQKYADLGAALQKITEEILVKLAKTLQQKTKLKSLCMAGGVALNCVANAKLIYENIFKEIYIQPTANDAGGAIGAAFFVWTQNMKQKSPKAIASAYLGPKYTEKEILSTLKKSDLKYTKISSIEKKVAKLLAAGKLVAWFQGEMETGPRALGHRSILSDPRNKQCLDVINEKVKLREPFRPLCPSILEEEVKNWVNVGKGKTIPDPAKYMLAAFDAKPGKNKIIPAVIHVDNTSRIQAVSKKTSAKYWKLINEFYKLTKVPVLVNTSFNIQEPIVCSPEDAVKTFKISKIDYLVLENYLCERSQ